MNRIKEHQFIKDIIALMKKHGVYLHECDDYDGEDNHCGYLYRFKGNQLDVGVAEIIEYQAPAIEPVCGSAGEVPNVTDHRGDAAKDTK